jgi:hypothetical protein
VGAQIRVTNLVNCSAHLHHGGLLPVQLDKALGKCLGGRPPDEPVVAVRQHTFGVFCVRQPPVPISGPKNAPSMSFIPTLDVMSALSRSNSFSAQWRPYPIPNPPRWDGKNGHYDKRIAETTRLPCHTAPVAVSSRNGLSSGGVGRWRNKTIGNLIQMVRKRGDTQGKRRRSSGRSYLIRRYRTNR